MSSKKIVMIGMIVGSTLGGYLPSLFGVSSFSIFGMMGNVIGGLLGIYIAYRLSV